MALMVNLHLSVVMLNYALQTHKMKASVRSRKRKSFIQTVEVLGSINSHYPATYQNACMWGSKNYFANIMILIHNTDLLYIDYLSLMLSGFFYF